MFCRKCGHEFDDHAHFCPRCGTRTNPEESTVEVTPTQSTLISGGKDMLYEIKSNITDSIAALGSSAKPILANIIAVLCSMILALMPAFKVSALGVVSAEFSLFDDLIGAGFLKPFFIIAYVLSLGGLVFPLSLKKPYKAVYFLPAKISAILSSLWTLFLLLGMSSSSDGLAALSGHYSLTLAGWLFIAATALTIYLSFKNSRELKKSADKEEV